MANHAVNGLGGAFLRAKNPGALYAWYEEHLGLKREHGCFVFPAAQQTGDTVLAFFSEKDEYWPPTQPAMLNLRVDDLDALLDRLLASGVQVDPKRDSFSYGKFGWIADPEGNRVELWQPTEA